MALIVETGAIVAGAESYISVADADTYHANRANTAWDSVDDKEAALRKATDYMVQMYRQRWKGFRKTSTQPLDWPRSLVALEPAVDGMDGTEYFTGAAFTYIVPNDTVPTEVKNACAEFALRAAVGELAADVDRLASSEKIGPITITYEPLATPLKRYVAIEALLGPFLSQPSFTAKLRRA
jgi:hypothetical protein